MSPTWVETRIIVARLESRVKGRIEVGVEASLDVAVESAVEFPRVKGCIEVGVEAPLNVGLLDVGLRTAVETGVGHGIEAMVYVVGAGRPTASAGMATETGGGTAETAVDVGIGTGCATASAGMAIEIAVEFTVANSLSEVGKPKALFRVKARCLNVKTATVLVVGSGKTDVWTTAVKVEACVATRVKARVASAVEATVETAIKSVDAATTAVEATTD